MFHTAPSADLYRVGAEHEVKTATSNIIYMYAVLIYVMVMIFLAVSYRKISEISRKKCKFAVTDYSQKPIHMSDVYVFLADGFEEIEALAPVDLMRRAGLKVTTVSVNDSTVVTGAHGIRVEADALITDTTFAHIPEVDADATFRYNVACVFNRGESAPSETAEVNFIQTGVNDLVASALKVFAGKGEIIVKGLAGEQLTVTNAAGLTIYKAAAEGDVTIPAAAGIYVVKAARRTVKVIVK